MDKQTSKKTETVTEYGGYVKNNVTGSYERLFLTSISAILAYGRAKEEAESRNSYRSDVSYDVDDIIVKHRTAVVTTKYSEWADDPFKKNAV